MSNSNNVLLTYEQTADLFGRSTNDKFSVRSVMRLCQQRKIQRVYPLPGKPRVVAKSVQAYIEFIISLSYDSEAQNGRCLQGVVSWQKSTRAIIHPTGGQDTQARMALKLEALLKSRKERNTKI